MRLKLEITGLESTGDNVRVEAQGRSDGAARWRPVERWTFTVPEAVGARYRLGQTLIVNMRPTTKESK